MRKNNSTIQSAPIRAKLETWRNDETRAEYMARTGSEGLGGQVPFVLACMILGVWVVWLAVQVATS